MASWITDDKPSSGSATGLVADAINDGTTTVAPSQNAVFDALASKANSANPTLTGTVTVPDASFSLAKLANISTPRFLGRRTASSGPVEEMTAPQAQSLLGDVQVGMPPVVGGYLHPPSIIASSARTLSGSLSNARTYANPCPIWVPSDCTIDALLAYQNVAATDSGATAELALSSPGPWPFAGTLLTTPVAFDATATAGLRTVALASPLAVKRGLYWGWLKFKTSTTAGTNPQFAHVGTLYTHYPVNSGVAPAPSVSTVFPYGAGLSGTASMPDPNTISTITWGNASQYLWIAARVSAV